MNGYGNADRGSAYRRGPGWMRHGRRMRHGNADRRGPYRSRSGLILGVCRGMADYFSISVFWTRFIAVCALLFTGLWPVAALYFLAALLMKKEPVVPLRNEEDEEFFNSLSASRTMAVNRLKRTYENLDRRLRRMEDVVTDREFDWERRLRES